MNKFNYIIFPYRSLHFKKKYGVSVRDLQIIEIIRNHILTENILVVDRPLSIYEFALGRGHSEDSYLRHLSWDLIGPLKQREWAEHCYSETYKKIEKHTKEWDNIIVLDFTPLAKISLPEIRHNFYWYDLIDNFTKHNRFTEKQKKLVKDKYEFVDSSANLITGVTSEALTSFARKKIVIPNGVYPHESHCPPEKPSYKYGFLGFVTDKFDLAFVKNLSRSDPDFSLIVYGDIFDKRIKKELSSITGVSLGGPFSRDQVPILMNSFKIGLIPYLESKSHDGSPLKLYEYMLFGKLVATSIDYEITGDFIANYNKEGVPCTIQKINRILLTPHYEEQIISLIKPDDYMETKVSNAIKIISERFTKAQKN